ncbi:hypothetical protein MPTK1_8g11710 [Marchantia polymorpha subsp. ruderalis]|uniref:Uncharacterized protein n=1 Tax=Marchantia polymorpha TaxID=3197 RepID=A0A2R6XMC9_MARPO|nr:hypothetical protein MARPO_0008s0044 [Marchantia polymorpha]PTQ47260.1 hypothetical protein MARPO_0008s0044 [Marchantia polymorpha]BBN19563.1 hypothetical protein Mp_8g11710 [Marchantia polymorpha subsp. ruderalis]BBN19564.1 hypothetical protein Mp_8g11710 [Marchantia polymorpha subsp. ruderalis]|eukprot:PTQ47259.1 hypothetical protein MARPO_0008s0044 [Marchantia polymorpha]
MEEDMECTASGLKKHLDFADVTLTLPTMPLPVVQISKNDDALDISASSPDVTLEGMGQDPAIEELRGALRREAQRIRKNLAGLDGVAMLPHSYKQQINEAEIPDGSEKELENLFSSLKHEYLEVTEKQGLLELLTKFDDEKKENERWLSDDVPEIQSLRAELMSLKQSNADTIDEIETLIHTVADDMNSFENNLSLATHSLENCDLELDKMAQVGKRRDIHEDGINMIKLAETPQDLEETIRLLEEQLRQNEREYEDTEAAMKQRIEQYNLEMEELQAQARQLDKEEESLRMIVDVSGRCLRSQTLLESINDVAVIAVGDDFVELQLTTDVPTMDDPCEAASGQGVKQELKHKLYIKVNSKSMGVETAELFPADVPIDDLVSSTQQSQDLNVSSESTKEGENAEFGRQFAYLVTAVHHRISVFALKSASLSSASNDPRYCVEYLPDTSVITVTIPGKLNFLIEVPQGWPMHGFSLRLRSLYAVKEESPASEELLEEAMELANQMPEYARHDVLSFVQAVEKIVTERTRL